MKISVFYEHIEKACEQTKKPLREVLAYVKACGIDGVEMDYDELGHDELAHDSQDILKNLHDEGLVISSIYGFCHLDIDPEEQKCLDVIDQAAKNGCSRVLIVPGFFSEADAKIFGECADDWEKQRHLCSQIRQYKILRQVFAEQLPMQKKRMSL